MIKKYKISILRFFVQLIYLTLFILAVLSNNIIFILTIISAMLLGPIFCGWLCFFGFFQDVSRYIGSIFKKKSIDINYSVNNFLRFSRYIILIGTVVLGGIFLFPERVKHSFSVILKGHLHINSMLWALIILGILSLFTKRFFCRYLCAYGAKLGIISLFRPFTIKRTSEKCIHCKICDEQCLMHIEVSKTNNLASPNCINCFRCIESCPKGCLNIGLRNYLNP